MSRIEISSLSDRSPVNGNAHSPALEPRSSEGKEYIRPVNGSATAHHVPTPGVNGNGAQASFPPPLQGELTLNQLASLTRQMYAQIRSRWLTGLVAATVAGSAVGWLFFHGVPEYTAETTVLAQSPLDKILNPGEPVSDQGQVREENMLRNHLSVMTSRTFLNRMADSFSDDDLVRTIAPYPKNPGQTDRELLMKLLNTKIDIDRERGRDFFTISVRHRTPAAAMMIAERFTSQYLQYLQSEYRVTSAAAIKILQEQADALGAEMRRLEDERRDYRKKYNLISVEENQSIISERLRRINAALSDVRMQRVGLETQLTQAKDDMTATNTPYSNPVLAAFGNNQALRIELDKMRAQREILANEYGPSHPKMIEANRVLTGLQQTLENNFQLAIADLRGKLDLVIASEKQLNDELTTAFTQSLNIDKLATRFNELGDELTAKRKTQTELLQHMSRTALSGQMPADVMRVIDPAYLKTDNVKRKLLLIALTGVVAVTAFICTPLVLQVFDGSVSASTDLEASLGKELLGAIPRLGKTRLEDRAHLVRNNVDFASVEAFLGLAGQVELLSKKHPPKKILITSTLPGEGKSMAAANLASTFARLGRRTLLIDCDFRRPTQGISHQIAAGQGLIPWAMANFPMSEDIFQPGGALGLVQLPCGAFLLPAGAVEHQPTRYLVHPLMGGLFDRLGEQFQVIVVDTPPAGVFQDVLILAQHCDKTLLIVRNGKAQLAQVKRVIREIDKTSATVLGVVLNDFDSSAAHPQMAYRHLSGKYGYAREYRPAPAKGTRQKPPAIVRA